MDVVFQSVSVDCGTEEGVVSPRQRDHINVMFHGELSYAEKLLLKQHRRGLLQTLPPALSTTHTQLRQSSGHSVDVTPSHSNISLDSDDSRTTKKPNIIKLLIGECVLMHCIMWCDTSVKCFVNTCCWHFSYADCEHPSLLMNMI